MSYRLERWTISLGVGAVLLLWAIAGVAADTAAGPPGADQTSNAITQIAQEALAYAGVLTAAGTVAMAFVELIKATLDLRRWFHQYMLNQWLGAEKPAVLPELLYLAIGDKRHESVLCGQPIEKMMGQLQAAARIALDYPDKFPRLFKFLTSTDFEPESEKVPVGKVAPTDREAWTLHARAVHDVSAHLRSTPASTTGTPMPIAQAASDAAQARARLASLVGRKLDGFQLRVEFWWSRSSQALSIVLSVVVMEVAVMKGLKLSGAEAFAIGLLGGLLAPFAKDFSQSLAKFAAK